MAFHVVYVAGGELDKVKKVKYVERIHNFAWLTQPYNKMEVMTIPAMEGIYQLDYITPKKEAELLSLVVTCSGYGENDYYNLWVDDQLWFDTWFPTEVKEGLFIGSSPYVYQLAPETKITMKFANVSGTQKKVWLGVRMLTEPPEEGDPTYNPEMLMEFHSNAELNTPTQPERSLVYSDMEPLLKNDLTNNLNNDSG